jgi:hypothetical protein
MKNTSEHIVEKIKTYNLCPEKIFCCCKSFSLLDNMEKYGTGGQITDDNTVCCTQLDT